MSETRRKFDQDFKEGVVRLVRETGKPIAQVAQELHDGTLGNWVNADRRRCERGGGTLSEDERAELVRLRKHCAELQCGVMSSSAVWPSGSRRRWVGSRGRVHRCSEGRSRHPARHRVPSAGSLAVEVFALRRGAAGDAVGHPVRNGSLAGPGSGQTRLRRQADQPEMVRRWNRDPHRRGQAVPGFGAGHGLTAGSGVRPVRAPRRAAWAGPDQPWTTR